MPAKSKAQQGLMGVALSMKRGNMPCAGTPCKMSKNMTEKQLKDYAGTKTKGLPKKVAKKRGKK